MSNSHATMIKVVQHCTKSTGADVFQCDHRFFFLFHFMTKHCWEKSLASAKTFLWSLKFESPHIYYKDNCAKLARTASKLVKCWNVIWVHVRFEKLDYVLSIKKHWIAPNVNWHRNIDWFTVCVLFKWEENLTNTWLAKRNHMYIEFLTSWTSM